MTINLHYKYSELDQRHEFFITTDDQNTLYTWVWFYLGKYLPDGVNLYPYNFNIPRTEKLKTYSRIMDAENIAKRIVKKINKKLAK